MRRSLHAAAESPLRGLRLAAAVAFAAFLAPTAAMACSCIRIAPEGFRMQADAIIEGRVTRVTRMAGVNAPVVARITVTRQVKGRTPRTILVQTPAHGEMCGYSFTEGQLREFLLSKANGRYATTICLMMGARR